MIKFQFLKYTAVFIIPLLTVFSFVSNGWLTFSTVIFSYFLIPSLEFLFSSNTSNLDKTEYDKLKDQRIFDYLLYLMVPIQFALLFFYLVTVSSVNLTTLEFVGMTMSMGLNCGVLGINVAHELGHRNGKIDQFLAKLLLMSSLYMHFIIEHNRGHHKYVSTPEDPSSARKGELVHFFWFRSIFMAYRSAWRLEANRLGKVSVLSFMLKNEMLRFQIYQLLLLLAIFWVFGFWPMVGFWFAALLGIIQLETVNYIEHYALTRKKVSDDRYERVQPWHSWNSNHAVGRAMLFELSRHSDHHYLANKKYQLLDHHDGSPQMPTGYPGMMLLAMIPPLWFKVMHRKLDDIPHLES
ncbi:MAG: alkane 1-monooxygenase [Reichenbachiella sp.]